MLAAHGQLHVEPVKVDFDVVLERQFRVVSVRREGTTWDSRLAPPNAGRTDAHVIHVLLECALECRDPGAGLLEAPTA